MGGRDVTRPVQCKIYNQRKKNLQGTRNKKFKSMSKIRYFYFTMDQKIMANFLKVQFFVTEHKKKL